MEQREKNRRWTWKMLCKTFCMVSLTTLAIIAIIDILDPSYHEDTTVKIALIGGVLTPIIAINGSLIYKILHIEQKKDKEKE